MRPLGTSPNSLTGTWPSDARLILLLAEGPTWDEVSERIECSRGFVASWNKRFVEQRIARLYSRHLGQVASVLTPELEARILEATRRAPGDGSTHWRPDGSGSRQVRALRQKSLTPVEQGKSARRAGLRR